MAERVRKPKSMACLEGHGDQPERWTEILSSAARWLLFLVFTVPVVIVACFALLVGGANAAHAIHLWWCRMTVRLMRIRLVAVNQERVVRDRPVVFLANHQSMLDILICGAVLNRQYRWLAKAELFRIPLLGWGMRRTGYVPVERGSGEKARQSFYAAARRARAGEALVVFPEGTVTTDGEVLPFRKGGFIIAREAGVTVQCLSISNTFRLLPDQEHRIIPRNRAGEVRVFVHEPQEPGEFARHELSEWVSLVRSQIAAEVRQPPFSAADQEPSR